MAATIRPAQYEIYSASSPEKLSCVYKSDHCRRHCRIYGLIMEGFIKAALTGMPRRDTFYKETWLENEFKDRVKHIEELSLPLEDKQAKINAAYIIFTDVIDKIREGCKEDT